MNAMSTRFLRVLIADDHPLYRQGLRQLIEGCDGLQVVGEVADGSDVAAACVAMHPDVVLMDISMPGLNGIEAARLLQARCPETGVVVLTADDTSRNIAAAIRAGARGYLMKGAHPEEIHRAVFEVGYGGVLFGPEVADYLLARFKQPPVQEHPFPQLTGRERSVLTMLADGKSNSRIAAELGLSAKTIRNYLSQVFAKLHVTDRTAAVIRARQAGLGS